MRLYLDKHSPAVGYVAREGGRVIGAIRLAPVGGGGLRVGHIAVNREVRRQQTGTKLYEKAARLACREYGGPLRSDIYRTADAQAFWEKQVRKGRATCAVRSLQGEMEYAKGWPRDMSISNRGGCIYYTLRCPAPRSLAGWR